MGEVPPWGPRVRLSMALGMYVHSAILLRHCQDDRPNDVDDAVGEEVGLGDRVAVAGTQRRVDG
jgi:hypothetical protein